MAWPCKRKGWRLHRHVFRLFSNKTSKFTCPASPEPLSCNCPLQASALQQPRCHTPRVQVVGDGFSLKVQNRVQFRIRFYFGGIQENASASITQDPFSIPLVNTIDSSVSNILNYHHHLEIQEPSPSPKMNGSVETVVFNAEPDCAIAKRAHYAPPWADVSIIGIAGSSGSGKSTLSHAIVSKLNLPWVVILSMVSSPLEGQGKSQRISLGRVGLLLQDIEPRVPQEGVSQRIRL